MDLEPEEARKPEGASAAAKHMVTIQGQNIDWNSECKYLRVALRLGRR